MSIGIKAARGSKRVSTYHYAAKERDRRKVEAEARNATYNTLTIQQKLDKLDAKLGIGIGAIRERTRLITQLQTRI